MTRSFTNILALIDSSKDSDPYLKAAIQVANLFDCQLHILLRNSSDSTSVPSEQNDYDLEESLVLQNIYQPDLKPGLDLHIHFVDKHLKHSTLTYARRNKIDLVLDWRRGSFPLTWLLILLRYSFIERKLECPILILSKDSTVKGLTNIILPIHHSLPAGNMVMAVRLARKFNAKIHLVGVETSRGSTDDNQVFMKACQLLRNNTNIEVECQLLKGLDIVWAVLRYGKKIDADIILSCTGTLHLVRFIRRLLFAPISSAIGKIPVMIIPFEDLNIQ